LYITAIENTLKYRFWVCNSVFLQHSFCKRTYCI